VSPEEFSKLVVNLPQAETLDLYRLEYIVRALYSEPKRTMAARARINLGMTIEYFDSRDGCFHRGRITRTQDTGVTIDDPDRKLRLTGLPYAALNFSGASFYKGSDAPIEQPRTAPPPEKRAQFKIGDRVSFMDRDFRLLVGTVVRVNAKSISVDADNVPGHWRVSPSLLTHMIEA
jgi:ribosomal protein L35AE/L33A